MIDVWDAAANGLWIVALSLVLAALSWARWLASQEERGHLQAALRRFGPRVAVDVGLLLLLAGLAATSSRWWERALWGVLGMSWLVSIAGEGTGYA